MHRSETPLIRRHATWNLLVAASAGLLAMLGLGIAVAWAVTSEERVTSYAVRGSVEGLRLDLGDADVEIVGAGTAPAVGVRRVDRSAFGQDARATRAVVGGELRLASACPRIVLGRCAASYRLRVPDNVPVVVRTGSGDIRFRDFRGSARVDTRAGNVVVERWCGFTMLVRTDSGSVRASATCQPERMELRTTSGAVAAAVPSGRYRVDADSGSGEARVTGLTAADDAPYRIQALSRSGSVLVEGGS